ncbi:alkane 1-monooxygenase [Xinfangfangia sp. CPCC 101601]|uniref:Alkane 1-monooxygenase n=1 Tax=Pseudogemmobacter lacusdianii TaxID=3069608 RepID=A0ABU0VVS0_9RHOB|nr:alkane 1-monooxygenase [Xinfangfangia sp. CPCC 101601]MDQ2065839.1 alkane 1-monooxygenase [Xinfangfangia sp. CPCC 101601]
MTKPRLLSKALSPATFAVVTLAPLPLIGLGLWQQGLWVLPGFGYMFLLSAIIDRLIPHVAGEPAPGQEFPGSDAVLVTVGLCLLALVPLAVFAVAGPSGLSPLARAVVFASVALWLGQVGHPAAHELIHRSQIWLFRLGKACYIAMLFGQHASAHRLVHHRHVATAQDPNSAPEGMGFYAFAARAWLGSLRAGHRAETALRRRRSLGAKPSLHPYWIYLIGTLLALLVAHRIAGAAGMAAWLGLASLAQIQILLSDYVQHYGLRRSLAEDGKPLPVGPAHSWNGGPWFSSALTLNAPRHSDHHSHPNRPYPSLRLPAPEAAPRLPWPLPIACTIALFPPLWRRAIRPHLRQWQPKPAAQAKPPR